MALHAISGFSHSERRERRKQMADAVAGGKTMVDAALEFSVTVHTVYNACKENGVKGRRGEYVGGEPQQDRGVNSVVTREQWHAVDWTKQDRDICVSLGVSRERVRQVRRVLHKPNADLHRQSRHGIVILRWLRENRDAVNGLSIIDIANMLPVRSTYGSVKLACRRLGIEIAKRSGVGSGVTRDNLIEFCTVTDAGCWEWDFKKHPFGYAQMGSTWGHHRAYELFNGSIPDGLLVCHHCDNPKCMNPKHLYAGTQKQNMRDRDVHGHNGAAKLNVSQIRDVRRLHAMGGFSMTTIGKKFGVTTSCVCNIIKGKAWPEEKLAAMEQYAAQKQSA